MADGNERILLTARDVQGWKDRKAEPERTIAGAERELAEIERKLEAAALLADRKGSGETGAAAGTAAADTDEDDGFGSPVAG